VGGGLCEKGEKRERKEKITKISAFCGQHLLTPTWLFVMSFYGTKQFEFAILH